MAGKQNFQASEEASFLNKENNMVIEATENSLAAMWTNQVKGISGWKRTGTSFVSSRSARSHANTWGPVWTATVLEQKDLQLPVSVPNRPFNLLLIAQTIIRRLIQHFSSVF